jgi:hypothetical protein
MLRGYKEGNWGIQVSSVWESEEKSQGQLIKKPVGRELPFRED